MSEKDFDLICIGRSCVDLYSGEFGVPLERAMTFTKSVGGSPMNIAIGTSRLGLRVGAITGVGQEDNGRYLKWQLSCEGVDVSAVKTDPKRLTAMVLLSIRGDNDFPLIQYRENCADMGLTAEDIDPDYLARAGAVLVTGTHLSREGVRSATMKVLETAKRLGLKCILDIDFRPNLWGFDVTEFAHHCPEEFFIAGGKTEAMEALREVRRLSKALLVFKLGDKGCAALPGDIPDSFVDEVVYPGFPVKVFNSIGAGDGFMSGFLRGWLRNEDLASCCRYANAAGAFAVSRLGCSSAYPSWTELQYFVSHGSKHKWLREDAMLEQIHWATNRRNKWKNLAVFAFDHRDPFSALAAETGRDAKAITAFKNLAFRAVAEASSELEGQNDVGILVDDTYGQSVLFESNRYPFWVGRSIEKTGVNPLMFEGKADVGSTLQAWPENHVVKCLFRPGAKDAPEVVEENERQLCRLFSGARSTGHDLLLEIIVDQPQTREEQDACLLRWMRRCYELGVYPDYWKILPVADQGTWQAIEALIGEYDPYCRGILFLGLNVAEAELVKRFAALPESPRALGFAIGRSIFLEPARKWFAGQMSDEDAVATMRDCFLRLARAWNGRNRG